VTLLAATADPRAGGMRIIASLIGRSVSGPRLIARRGAVVELEQETYPRGLLTPGGVPQAEVADLVQALGQDMLEEPTHEFVTGHADGPPAIGFAMLVADGHGLVVEADDAGVGYGDTEDVACEIVEHGLLALTPGRAVDDPGLGPDGVGNNEVGATVCEPVAELATHELGERLDRNQEAAARRMPQMAVIRDVAAGDQAVDVRVKGELLRPGVQDGENTDGAADVAGVTGKLMIASAAAFIRML